MDERSCHSAKPPTAQGPESTGGGQQETGRVPRDREALADSAGCVVPGEASSESGGDSGATRSIASCLCPQTPQPDGQPAIGSWPRPLQAEWLWEGRLTPPGLSFLSL